MVISINGNVDKQKTISELSKIFNSSLGKKISYSNYSISDLKSGQKIETSIKDLKTSWIIMGWQTCGVLSYIDCVTLQVIDSLLGTGMSSRLFKNLRDKDGLAYQLGSQFSPNVLKGAFIVYIGTNPENLSYATEKMRDEVFRLKKEFVGSKELQEAKDKLLGNYILSQETNLDKAVTVGWFETTGRGFDFEKKYFDLVNSVTESDIIEVANKYFNDKYILSIVK